MNNISFKDIIAQAKQIGPVPVAVAAAEDVDVLRALKDAVAQNLIQAILTGNKRRIEELAKDVGLLDYEVIDQPDNASAAKQAVQLVATGQAKIVMKGFINTSDLLRAVLDKECGLRTARRLSHLAALEHPGERRLLFVTDGAITPNPDFAAKVEILDNALVAMRSMGYSNPKVAALAANEQVNPKIPATSQAADLASYVLERNIPCILEGPIALDVAISKEAAKHKNIKSVVSGEVDLFLCPNLEAGNILLKSLIYWSQAIMAGLVLGAKNPIILPSRSDPPEAKLNSIALAVLASVSQA